MSHAKQAEQGRGARAAETSTTRSHFHIRHALTVEGVMRWYANDLGFGRRRGLLGDGRASARHRF